MQLGLSKEFFFVVTDTDHTNVNVPSKLLHLVTYDNNSPPGCTFRENDDDDDYDSDNDDYDKIIHTLISIIVILILLFYLITPHVMIIPLMMMILTTYTKIQTLIINHVLTNLYVCICIYY